MYNDQSHENVICDWAIIKHQNLEVALGNFINLNSKKQTQILTSVIVCQPLSISHSKQWYFVAMPWAVNARDGI